MHRSWISLRKTIPLAIALLLLLAGAPLAPDACAQSGHKLLGGPRGVVRSAQGELLEGIMVQIISQKTAIRTTVYSNEMGQYEFPRLESGVYTLRIARPLEFRPFVREAVKITGADPLEEIVLERVSDTEFLPPTPEILSQLTGAEWLLNLEGTAEEKRTFMVSCNWCHSYEQVFRTRFDERSWAIIVDRMVRSAGSPLINTNPRPRPFDFLGKGQVERIVKWLARVRGPDSKDDSPLYVFPRPRGAATRVIVTEYELPRTMLATHDVAGDSKGYLWYSPHRSPYIGRLDPRTGEVKEYRVPDTPGALPGTHWIWVGPNDIVWASENWTHHLVRFDPRTEQFKKILLDTPNTPINSPMGGNYALAPDGFIWKARANNILKIHPETGEYVKKYPMKVASTYGSAVSDDGRYFAGGAWPADVVAYVDIQTGEVVELPTQLRNAGPARGAFDREGNAWFGGRGGVLVKLEPKARRLKEYPLPTPYASLYGACTDKHSEVWSGELHAGRFARFNPQTAQWTEYVLPEHYAHDRKCWVDNSSDPVTVWYIDTNSFLVRLQPLE